MHKDRKSYDYRIRKGIRKITWEEFHRMCKELAARRVHRENFDIIKSLITSTLSQMN